MSEAIVRAVRSIGRREDIPSNLVNNAVDFILNRGIRYLTRAALRDISERLEIGYQQLQTAISEAFQNDPHLRHWVDQVDYAIAQHNRDMGYPEDYRDYLERRAGKSFLNFQYAA